MKEEVPSLLSMDGVDRERDNAYDLMRNRNRALPTAFRGLDGALRQQDAGFFACPTASISRMTPREARWRRGSVRWGVGKTKKRPGFKDEGSGSQDCRSGTQKSRRDSK